MIAFLAWSKLVLCVSIGLIGAAALYCACFLYEDQEGKLQNRIVQLWIDIDDRQKRGQSFALASKAAGLVGRILDAFLGKRIWSLRMVGMSLCLSIGIGMLSMVVVVMYFFVTSSTPLSSEDPNALIFATGLVVFTLSAIWITARYQKNHWFAGLSLFLPALAFVWLGSMRGSYLSELSGHLFLANWIALFLSTVADILFVVLVRLSLRRLTQRPTTGSFGTAIIAQAALIVAIIFSLNALFNRPGDLDMLDLPITLGLLSVSTVVFSLSFIALLVFLPIHRLFHKIFWPAASRLVYPLARFEIIRNRKVMVGIGIACIAMISPPFAELLKKVGDLFH